MKFSSEKPVSTWLSSSRYGSHHPFRWKFHGVREFVAERRGALEDRGAEGREGLFRLVVLIEHVVAFGSAQADKNVREGLCLDGRLAVFPAVVEEFSIASVRRTSQSLERWRRDPPPPGLLYSLF